MPPPRLTYNYDTDNQKWTFTILQLADLHLGEEQFADWGPEQDRKTWLALHSYLERTASVVDLIVLSGDQLTANNCYNPQRNCTLYYIQLGQHLAEYNIPFAMIFGNHDDQVTDRTQFVATTRQELVETMQRHFPSLSLMQSGPSNVTGVSNYWLDLYFPPSVDGSANNWDDTNRVDPHDNNMEIASRIAFLDTGGGQLRQTIDSSQLQWFLQENNRDTPHHRRRALSCGADIPVVVFAHIPTQEFTYLNDQQCVGQNGDNGIAPLSDGDDGLISTLLSQSNVHFLAVGHNHGNDYCCPVLLNNTKNSDTTTNNKTQQFMSSPSTDSNTPSSLHLCFGRHSGYGGYGTWDKGARLYELQLQMPPSQDSGETLKMIFTWKSWILMESGLIQDEYNPFQT